ncbi:MAG: bifunctional tetrahydrofolate synthase/dihydrofolate synthase [Gammaproteobacteria bacterium]|nr:bifunctional tetrahydrofolate synthase/dihydrofolate synthase [Gammaproteobacteria bacterium]
MRFKSLNEWLSWQETLHPSAIELGLDRVRPVLRRMGLEHPPFPVVTVAGTNGKGSSVAMLEAILRAAGYRAGVYTSPHLLRYTERIRIYSEEIDEGNLCSAFERVDQARGETSLTYFEFGTLAAIDIFAGSRLDVAIMEVGMGGRLDAVNLLDADIALVTSIGIDHAEWLGDTREKIAFEKAGIFRSGRPAICGDSDPPQILIDHAAAVGAPLYRLGHEFGYQVEGPSWSWWSQTRRRTALPHPALRGAFQLQNAAAVLMVLELLDDFLPLSQHDVREGLTTVSLPGRFQVLPGAPLRIFDVAHNPHGAQVLAQTLRSQPCAGKTHAVMAMLADKDIGGVVAAMRGVVDVWHAAGLSVGRGASAVRVAEILRAAGVSAPIHVYDDVAAAYAQALAGAQTVDRIVVFGSFYTVAEAMRQGV